MKWIKRNKWLSIVYALSLAIAIILPFRPGMAYFLPGVWLIFAFIQMFKQRKEV